MKQISKSELQVAPGFFVVLSCITFIGGWYMMNFMKRKQTAYKNNHVENLMEKQESLPLYLRPEYVQKMQ